MADLKHYGTPRHSGRYPWGSGDHPYQRTGDFLSRVESMHKEGKSEKEIADELGISTTQLRVQKSMAKDARTAELRAQAQKYRDEGMSLNQIAEKMGFANDSSVRNLLSDKTEARLNKKDEIAETLKKEVDSKGIIDVGKGVEYSLNISDTRLDKAVEMLRAEGYKVYGGRFPQINNPGKFTTWKVVCTPDTEHSYVYQHLEEMKLPDAKPNPLDDYISRDGGVTLEPKFVYPASMDSKRLMIRYRDDEHPELSGLPKDGVIEIRRGVKDLDLGESHYAQVRILVDGTHYIKGMAIYGDDKDFPKGTDIIFNTNKTADVPKMQVLKEIGSDPHNPFGALIKEGINDYSNPDSVKTGGQYYYIDSKGNKKLGLINKTRGEGDWDTWADRLPSQFLSKQPVALAEKQLKLTLADKRAELEEIKSLNNPTVKRVLLEKYALQADSDSVHLQAAALPRQKYQVILPLTTIKDNEVYAPNYRDGEMVALVRYPHAGQFEIPIVRVNNKQPEGVKVLGKNPVDAIGINSKVAERLSGADFDGDTVMVIPTNSRVRISNKPKLKDLEGFDPKVAYPERAGMKYLKKGQVGNEMGKISNLITDMTIKGASEEEMARAVKHSMVVIDANKHKLDYKRSEAENGIAALKKRYQGHYDEDGRYHEGVSTIISRAKSPEVVLKRKGNGRIDPETGKVTYKEVTEYYTDKKGKQQVRTQNSTKMDEAFNRGKDATSLMSDLGGAIEQVYAHYANDLRSMANEARRSMYDSDGRLIRLHYNAGAKKTYAKEVESLNSKLNLALRNSPKERQAQAIANAELKAKKEAYPELKDDKKTLKKMGQQALTRARTQVGAQRQPIIISDNEWKAIQAGAVSDNILKQILDHTDIDKLRERATPRTSNSISSAQQSRIQAMKASGHTNAEIAAALHISASTVSKYL